MEEPNERLDQRSAFDYHRRIHQSEPDPAQTQTASEARRRHGDELTAISDGLVALLKEFYGRGPTQAKSYYQDDLVVCVLRGGYSQVEQTLLDGGRGSAVIEQRMAFQELMRDRFEEVVEKATGRKVIGFMSGNQQEPDLMCEVFVLAPTDLV
ncbi:MAG TPA: Na-translocating system protein MpsC family protein [Solirubrobacterales bacterium]